MTPAPDPDTELARLREAVHELEEMVSEAESRANERGNTIFRLRSLLGRAADGLGSCVPDLNDTGHFTGILALEAECRAASTGETPNVANKIGGGRRPENP